MICCQKMSLSSLWIEKMKHLDKILLKYWHEETKVGWQQHTQRIIPGHICLADTTDVPTDHHVKITYCVSAFSKNVSSNTYKTILCLWNRHKHLGPDWPWDTSSLSGKQKRKISSVRTRGFCTRGFIKTAVRETCVRCTNIAMIYLQGPAMSVVDAHQCQRLLLFSNRKVVCKMLWNKLWGWMSSELWSFQCLSCHSPLTCSGAKYQIDKHVSTTLMINYN